MSFYIKELTPMVKEPKKQRIVIFSGGSLGDWALAEARPDDLLIGADRGALFLVANGLQPHLAIGDFDSVTESEREQICQGSQQVLDCDPILKDLTDTEMAFVWALKQHPAEIVMLGALGTRFDHSLANVHLLSKGLQEGIICRIIDAHNEIRLIDRAATLCKGAYSHVSLLPLSREVHGITLEGFQYPLQDASLSIGQSLGISNIITAGSGDIRIREGLLLVIRSKD
jgi:thiamine pyrophosphokinase